MNKFYITTPIYYVNDKPHLGHAYTTIAADILARYYRKQIGDDNVFRLTGTDEHGVKIAQAAEKAGKLPQDFSDEVSAQFQATWQKLNISNNDFIRTTEFRHEEAVIEILLKLKDAKGPSGQPVLYQGEYEGLYCTGCEAYKTESDLVDGKCPDHPKQKLNHLKEANWFFRLSDFQTDLKKIIESGAFKVEPESRKNEVLSFIHDGLQDIAISRASVDWGIKVRFAHGFFTIDGQKMSKSIGNVIDPNELVDTYGSDAARYLIISQFPFGNDGDIKAEEFVKKYNADLANGLGNLVSRVLGMAEKYFSSSVPAGKYTADFDLKSFWQTYDKNFSDLKLYDNIQLIQQLVSWCDNYIDSEKPWEPAKNNNDKLSQVLYNLIEIVRHLAYAISPYLPETSDQILKKLNIQSVEENYREIGLVKEGTKLDKGESLFMRK